MVEKVISYLILPIFILGCTAFDLEEYNASVAADALEIKRVAVIDFSFDLPERGRIDRGKIQRPQNAGVLVADIFTEHLLGEGLYQIVEREHIKAILQKYNVRSSQLYASPNWQEIRKALNIDGVILGAVLDYGEWRSTFNWGA